MLLQRLQTGRPQTTAGLQFGLHFLWLFPAVFLYVTCLAHSTFEFVINIHHLPYFETKSRLPSVINILELECLKSCGKVRCHLQLASRIISTPFYVIHMHSSTPLCFTLSVPFFPVSVKTTKILHSFMFNAISFNEYLLLDATKIEWSKGNWIISGWQIRLKIAVLHHPILIVLIPMVCLLCVSVLYKCHFN